MTHPTYIVRMIIFVLFFISAEAYSKNTKVRQTQEVNFSEMNLNGTIRNPDGAYLVQKKGFKFFPLHHVQSNLDLKIREASLYID